MTPIISLQDIGKHYVLRAHQGAGYRTLRDEVVGFLRAPFRRPSRDVFWALQGISFEVQPGEVIGLIGRNGAGKSTLLKVLARITQPTTGEARLRGRVGSLLEVGTGFHAELTGRENIFLSGAILGMSRQEVKRKFEEIVTFAEVEKFIDTPVKRYSSGMYMRLAFSVAAHLETEILLVDEVLAVGDQAFQRKCLGKMGEVAQGGRTVLFVSHNMGAVTELCTRGILLDGGRMLVDGALPEVIDAYAKLNSQGASRRFEAGHRRPVDILRVAVSNGQGQETTHFDLDEDITITTTYEVKETLEGLQLSLTVNRNMIDVVHTFDTDHRPDIPTMQPGVYQAVYTLPRMFLKAGTYGVRLTSGIPTELFQNLEDAIHFTIEEISVNTQAKGFRNDRPGCVISPGTWQTRRSEAAGAT